MIIKSISFQDELYNNLLDLRKMDKYKSCNYSKLCNILLNEKVNQINKNEKRKNNKGIKKDDKNND